MPVLPDSAYYTRLRRRQIKTPVQHSQNYFLGNQVGSTDSFAELSQWEETRDRENGWWQQQRWIRSIQDPEYRNRLRMYDIGAPFTNVKESVEMGGVDYDLAHSTPSQPMYYRYRGPLFASIITDTALQAGPFVNAYSSSSESELDAYGTTAIARCSPANPHASLLVAIGELYRDGLPAIPGLTTLKKGDVGGEYLNYQFGIAPLVSDIRALNKSLMQAESMLAQYVRDSGRLMRRRYSFLDEEKLVSRVVVTNAYPRGGTNATNSYLWQSSGQTEKTVTETTSRWFSGAFTYKPIESQDLLGSIHDQIRKMNNLYGILPTSEVLWNLAPWSWAADWVTNIGDIMHNLSMFQSDGLLMRWGYIMEHKLRVEEHHHSGSVAKLYGGGTAGVKLTQRFNQETKRRRPATPFGFGFDMGSLTARQEAIIAALILSKGHVSFK